jgi:zinc transport system ATP-binding protein
MNTLLEAQSLGFSRQGKAILEDVNLHIMSGEILTLIGPNGAGKTTLTRILLGLLKPDSGQIKRAAGLRIGYMPQKFAIDPHLPLTVLRFLKLTRRPQLKLGDITAELGIDELLKQPVHSISGGELQRVLLARALLAKPHLLILDEPVQGVDVGGQARLYKLIVSLRDRLGCGVMMVSHDLHLVMASTDTVVCLNHHVCCHGHPDTVSTDPAFLELFGQPQDSALAVYTHHHDHDHDRCDEFVQQQQAGGEPS